MHRLSTSQKRNKHQYKHNQQIETETLLSNQDPQLLNPKPKHTEVKLKPKETP